MLIEGGVLIIYYHIARVISHAIDFPALSVAIPFVICHLTKMGDPVMALVASLSATLTTRAMLTNRPSTGPLWWTILNVAVLASYFQEWVDIPEHTHLVLFTVLAALRFEKHSIAAGFQALFPYVATWDIFTSAHQMLIFLGTGVACKVITGLVSEASTKKNKKNT